MGKLIEVPLPGPDGGNQRRHASKPTGRWVKAGGRWLVVAGLGSQSGDWVVERKSGERQRVKLGQVVCPYGDGVAYKVLTQHPMKPIMTASERLYRIRHSGPDRSGLRGAGWWRLGADHSRSR